MLLLGFLGGVDKLPPFCYNNSMSKEIENKNKREVDMMKYMFKITRKDSGAFYEFRIAT